jgi:DNA-binding transcriptional regulator YiaG
MAIHNTLIAAFRLAGWRNLKHARRHFSHAASRCVDLITKPLKTVKHQHDGNPGSPWVRVSPRGFRLGYSGGVSCRATAAAVDHAHVPPLLSVGQGVLGGVSDNADRSIRFGISARDRSACSVEKSIYSAEYQLLCGLLRELRHEAGLTQVQVAEQLEVPQSFVSKYESGERRLDVVELGHVAQALGVSLRVVLERLKGEKPGGKGHA